MDVDEDIDQLYDLDPDEFVAARDDLARRLRSDKRRDEAATVKALRRPTVVAWAVNQLVRRKRADIEDLLAKGEKLRQSQRETMGGGDAAVMRQATAERRKTVDALTKAAAAILQERGSPASDSTLDQVSATLEAASSDPEAGGLVLAGRLAKELPPPSGFGELSLDDALLASAGAARDERRRAEELADAAAGAEKRAAEARRGAQAAAEEVARLERELARARQAAEAAEQAAAETEEEADAARREADGARR